MPASTIETIDFADRCRVLEQQNQKLLEEAALSKIMLTTAREERTEAQATRDRALALFEADAHRKRIEVLRKEVIAALEERINPDADIEVVRILIERYQGMKLEIRQIQTSNATLAKSNSDLRAHVQRIEDHHAHTLAALRQILKDA